MNTMLFINSDLNKQAQALEIKISKATKSYHLLRLYLNEKLNFYHILVRNAKMCIRSKNQVNQNNPFIKFKIQQKSSKQYTVENVTKFYCRADIFEHLYFSSTTTDTSHIPPTIMLNCTSVHSVQKLSSPIIQELISFF